jgi:hypothetical protein
LKAKLVANKKTRAPFNVRGAVNILGSPYIRLLERKLTAEAAKLGEDPGAKDSTTPSLLLCVSSKLTE